MGSEKPSPFVCLGCGGDAEKCDCPAGYGERKPDEQRAGGVTGDTRRYEVGPGYVRAKSCPDCMHTRCGEDCVCNCDAAHAEHEAATLRTQLAAAERERGAARSALAKISAIRDSIIGTQRGNWSAHIYPLVAALGEAGFEGVGYDVAHKEALTLIAERDAANARAEQAERDREERRIERDEYIVRLDDAITERNSRCGAYSVQLERAEAERDAATSRAETAEGLLRTTLDAGRPMATLCFNWAQADDRFSSAECRMLKDMQLRWDEVCDAARAHLQSLKGGSDAG